MKRQLLTVGAISVFLIGIIMLSSVYPASTLFQYIDLIQLYVKDHVFVSVPIFFVIYAVAVIASLPIASFLTLLGGFLYGAFLGTLIIVVSATLGALIIFSIAKTLLHDVFNRKFGTYIEKINSEVYENGLSHMLFLRLIPLFPFFLVNIAPAFSKIKTRDYVVGTFFGIIPGTFVYANAGKQLGSIRDTSDILSPDIIIALSLLGVLSIMPILYKKYKKNKISTDVTKQS